MENFWSLLCRERHIWCIMLPENHVVFKVLSIWRDVFLFSALEAECLKYAKWPLSFQALMSFFFFTVVLEMFEFYHVHQNICISLWNWVLICSCHCSLTVDDPVPHLDSWKAPVIWAVFSFTAQMSSPFRAIWKQKTWNKNWFQKAGIAFIIGN